MAECRGRGLPSMAELRVPVQRHRHLRLAEWCIVSLTRVRRLAALERQMRPRLDGGGHRHHAVLLPKQRPAMSASPASPKRAAVMTLSPATSCMSAGA